MSTPGVLCLLAVGASTWLIGPLKAKAADACSANAENRKLDYWLGDWVVTNPGSPGSSRSKVHLELGQCVVVETWDNGKGHSGENRFAYSADDKSWRGMFADNEGRVHVFFEGKVASGRAEFDGPSRRPDGRAMLNRIRIVRVSADKVEQIWEKSIDEGVAWSTAFRGEYTRQMPPIASTGSGDIEGTQFGPSADEVAICRMG